MASSAHHSVYAAAVLALAAAPSSALTIKLTNIGGVAPGSQAEAGFKAAAGFWERALANSVTVNLNVGFSALGANIIGSTSSRQYSASASAIEAQLRTNGNSTLDAVASANLPTLTGGALKVITSGYKTSAKGGVNTAVKLYDADGSANNANVIGTSANLKALGFAVGSGADASITFSSNFSFDFDPNNGIAANQVDFIGVAIHEIGHALGFVSGVDTYDYYGNPAGPGRRYNTNLNNYAIGTVLDLYRYSNDPTNLVAGSGGVLDWSVKTPSYFSIDRGATVYGGGYFSTGAYNGDKRQASHWRDAAGNSTPLGLMDPTLGFGQRGTLTGLDLAAFDAIGWNLTGSVSAPGGSAFAPTPTNASLSKVVAVPEPATWALMIAGFGMVGGALRRRSGKVVA